MDVDHLLQLKLALDNNNIAMKPGRYIQSQLHAYIFFHKFYKKVNAFNLFVSVSTQLVKDWSLWEINIHLINQQYIKLS